MDALLQSNIKKSLRIIVEENPKVPDFLITIIEEEPTKIPPICEAIVKSAFQVIPWFYRNSCGELQSPQSSFFGFYAIRNVIRGIFLGLRFIQSGDLLRENEFYAASVISYYTASFHLLYSFLALNGRIVVDQVIGAPKIIRKRVSESTARCSLEPQPEAIIGILARDNKWKFEPRRRSHKRQWNELESILLKRKDKIPEFLLSFFKYILYYENTLSESDLIQKGIQRLIEVRHASIYRGYGYDDDAHDAITNREFGSNWDVGRKSEKYRNFAIGLLAHVLRDVITIEQLIPVAYMNKIQTELVVSVNTPPIEFGPLLLQDHPGLSNDIEQLYNWLMPKA